MGEGVRSGTVLGDTNLSRRLWVPRAGIYPGRENVMATAQRRAVGAFRRVLPSTDVFLAFASTALRYGVR